MPTNPKLKFHGVLNSSKNSLTEASTDFLTITPIKDFFYPPDQSIDGAKCFPGLSQKLFINGLLAIGLENGFRNNTGSLDTCNLFISLAGTPPTTVYDGTSSLTSELAPTMAPSPIRIPGKRTAYYSG